ncbi:RNA exonuclease 1 homolog [Sphaeramia orbicularis]|uniref:RNA exonuclease 1 homolog n=1 Tax=Sphaeramia orbicularis TaxID=375764 RepID=UPI00117BE525|nr:RNA exonuclease 1 homolog [Sphaeramia orbicularis]
MFSSSGLFANISCPLQKRGLCGRPHCQYKHASELAEMFGTSHKSVDNSPGVHLGVPVTDETTGDCLQELERINKEIETVQHEVEQEQRRLSHYRIIQADSRNTTETSNFSFAKCVAVNKKLDRDTCGHYNCAKGHSQARKYVLDNSKPRTDLEYDPLSNFSADLRSYSSSNNEQKVKNGQGLKREKHATHSARKPSHLYQIPLSRSPSPEHSDPNEEGILIIDISPSPDKKIGQTLTSTNSPVSSFQDTTEKVYCTKNNQDISNVCHNKNCENTSDDGNVIDLTRYSEDGATSPELSDELSHSCIDQLLEETINVDELPHIPVPCSGKMNPMHPQVDHPKKSHFHKTSGAKSFSPYRQCMKQTQKSEQPAQSITDNIWSLNRSLSLVPQKISSRVSGQMQDEDSMDCSSPSHSQRVSAGSLCESQYTLPASNLTRAQLPSESTDLHLMKEDKDVIVIVSSSDEMEELDLSDVDFSDTDPVEECYRIFMEANNEDKGNEEQPVVSFGNAAEEKPDVNVKLQGLTGKKRVAHEAKLTEQPVAKSKPQPQVLVPLRGPVAPGSASQSTQLAMFRKMEQKASVLTASVKAGQASISQRKPEPLSTPPPPAPLATHPQQTPSHDAASVNYIPLGATVIDVGNNLHLILPEGTVPLPSTSSPVTSVLTPITPVHTNPVIMKQTYQPPGLTPIRHRTTPPAIIPPLPRKPSLSSAFATTNANSCTPTQVHALKPVATKRKAKQQCETVKVPHDIRQRYVNMFTEEFLKTTANVNDAFEKALTEERTVYNRSVNKLKYLSVAVNALKRLRNQSAAPPKNENRVNSQRSKGNIPLNLEKLKGNGALYECLKDYIMTEGMLMESNFPIQCLEKPGRAVLFNDNKKSSSDPFKRICCRCGSTYSVNQTGKHTRKEECTYHYGKGVENRVPGGVETRYSCCEGVMGAPGCQVFKLHVSDSFSLDGFVFTGPRDPSDTSCPGVYSLNCEMCYTIQGLELSRVTVVNPSLQVVYDTFVKPDHEVIDYNTRFSGISEEDVKGNCTSLRNVQETLLSFISADTILIGHGLETDLCVLKLIHGMVVDTSVVFPHRLGPPHKLTLNSLTAEYLRRIIQESVCGHDTAEDAAACMELMLWKAKEDGRLKK